MTPKDLRRALTIRTEALLSGYPDLIIRYIIYTDEEREWGILEITNEDGAIIGLEFFETADSWKRPSSVQEFTYAVEQGIPVTVILPDEAYFSFRHLFEDLIKEGFSTYRYSNLGIGQMLRV
jgi:hypothetical protein